MGRRSYLRLIGATAAAGGAATAVTPVAGESDDDGGPERIDVDYDEHHDASARYNGLADVYRVWNERSGTDPEITGDRPNTDGRPGSDDRCLAHHFDGDQMTSNTVYPFDDNHGENVDEVHQRFRVHPNGMTLADSDTIRFFWAGLRNGGTSSGGTSAADIPNGVDGWSIRLGFTRRGAHEHPDGYTLFVYIYHMDQDSHIPEIELTDQQVRMDEWNDVQCHQVLNTFEDGQANADGEFRVWVDGELAFERTDYRWVSAPDRGIQEAGPHGYWWGSNQHGQTIYFDDHHIAVGGTLDDAIDSEEQRT